MGSTNLVASYIKKTRWNFKKDLRNTLLEMLSRIILLETEIWKYSSESRFWQRAYKCFSFSIHRLPNIWIRNIFNNYFDIQNNPSQDSSISTSDPFGFLGCSKYGFFQQLSFKTNLSAQYLRSKYQLSVAGGNNT